DLAAGRALSARLDRGPAVAVQAAGEEPRGRRLSDPARARQQVRRSDAPLGDRVRQRARDGVLADQVRKSPWAPLAREREVRGRMIDHRNAAVEDGLSLTCGARERLLSAASFRT